MLLAECRQANGMHEEETAAGTQSHCHADSTMPQVDFAPSMAALMGVPVPFGNIGKISGSLWDVAYSSNRSGITESSTKSAKHGDTQKRTYATALSNNAAQVGGCLVCCQALQLKFVVCPCMHACSCTPNKSLSCNEVSVLQHACCRCTHI